MFRALLLDRTDDGVAAAITDLDDARLPAGEVTIAVEASSLNYKDGMILRGLGRLVRDYPHVPGVDLAGVVESSDDPAFSPGDRVVCTGRRMGEIHWGGYATKARLPAEWVVPLPDSISTRQAMQIGTAGFTAMQALRALERRGLDTAEGRSLLVTGASGGVGSMALVWGSRAGHHLTASTGKLDHADGLRALGASDVIDRNDIAEAPTRPLGAERWAGCIDAVGGDTLANVLTEMAYDGAVAACGLTAGNGLATTVIPFLLRGVDLLGIDSVLCPSDVRLDTWAAMGTAMDDDIAAHLDANTRDVGLAEVDALADEILAGRIRGRVVVDPAG